MSRLPIRLRLTLVFAVVMAVVLAGLGVFLYVRLEHSLDERIADTLESRSAALAEVVRSSGIEGVDASLLTGEEGIAEVVDARGTTVFAAPSRTTFRLRPDEVAAARRRELTIDRDGYRVRAEPVGDVVVVAGELLDDRDEALDALATQLLVALPIALLASSLVGYFVAGGALRPVDAMRSHASEISASTSSQRLPLPAAHDEVYRLGETLNEMLGRLDAGLERERRFVADASHELRTPLAILKTELEVALRQPRSGDELESAIRSAAEETDRLVRLAEDLLLVARSDQSELELRPVAVATDELLDATAARFAARATTAGRAIEVAAEPGLVVEVDRTHADRALANLVENALNYGAGPVRLRAEGANGRVELHVTDEGSGFDQSFLPVAFERFARADDARERGGTGLGLAIVDAIAHAHGGSAHAANLAGGGADVWIALPTRLNGADAPGTDRADVG
jgi:two-component system OmpR family sensor kinase